MNEFGVQLAAAMRWVQYATTVSRCLDGVCVGRASPDRSAASARTAIRWLRQARAKVSQPSYPRVSRPRNL